MNNRTYSDSILIRGSREDVFAYFIDPRLLARWIADEATVDAKAGGRFTLRFGDRRVEGRYVDIEAPSRVVISLGRAGSPTFPPEASVLEVSLSAENGGTRVAIIHTGLPPAEYDRHALGWKHYLARLAEAASGKDPDPHFTPESLTRGADRTRLLTGRPSGVPAAPTSR